LSMMGLLDVPSTGQYLLELMPAKRAYNL
jgi:hypothetical protein